METKRTVNKKCLNCGKPVVVRDIRDKKPAYCSRVCGNLSRFSKRYEGTNSGPMDKPVNLQEKTKWANS